MNALGPGRGSGRGTPRGALATSATPSKSDGTPRGACAARALLNYQHDILLSLPGVERSPGKKRSWALGAGPSQCGLVIQVLKLAIVGVLLFLAYIATTSAGGAAGDPYAAAPLVADPRGG